MHVEVRIECEFGRASVAALVALEDFLMLFYVLVPCFFVGKHETALRTHSVFAAARYRVLDECRSCCACEIAVNAHVRTVDVTILHVPTAPDFAVERHATQIAFVGALLWRGQRHSRMRSLVLDEMLFQFEQFRTVETSKAQRFGMFLRGGYLVVRMHVTGQTFFREKRFSANRAFEQFRSITAT